MQNIFLPNQSEEYYKRILLLDKLKPFLTSNDKQFIFNKRYCWNILLKDKFAPSFCFHYAQDILQAPFPEGEKYIALDTEYSLWYAINILNDKFELGEEAIRKKSYTKYRYFNFIMKKFFTNYNTYDE